MRKERILQNKEKYPKELTRTQNSGENANNHFHRNLYIHLPVTLTGVLQVSRLILQTLNNNNNNNNNKSLREMEPCSERRCLPCRSFTHDKWRLSNPLCLSITWKFSIPTQLNKMVGNFFKIYLFTVYELTAIMKMCGS